MTALGFLYPGHVGEDEYPRIEQLLGSDIRVDVVHTDPAGEADHGDALSELGSPRQLEEGLAELRLSGADAVVWACTRGSFAHGPDGARDQVRALARAAGLPASSTSFAFVHAARELGLRRVAVGATYPDDVARLFADFLGSGGLEAVAVTGSGTAAASVAEIGARGGTEVLELARAADRPDAEAVLLPDTALHTAAHLPALERDLGKPVLTANQVTVWECLRLADRRVNAPRLGVLFTREPVIQA